jgi:hypothetical protein
MEKMNVVMHHAMMGLATMEWLLPSNRTRAHLSRNRQPDPTRKANTVMSPEAIIRSE